MTLKENLNKYISEGLSKNEIINKLKIDGFDAHEIDKVTKELPTIPLLVVGNNEADNFIGENKPKPNFKSILMGMLFLGLGASRLLGVRGVSGDFNTILGVLLVAFGGYRLVTGLMGKK